MSILNISSSRALPESELESITQLAVTLSGQLARVDFNEIPEATAEALQGVAQAMRVDTCQLIEFSESGTVSRSFVPRGTAKGEDGQHLTPPLEDWLVERLARGELAVISRTEDLPREAITAREQQRQTGSCSVLGLPASVAGRVVCALVLDSRRMTRRWPQPLVERLQLVSEILGAALQRRNHENALRSEQRVLDVGR